MTTHAVVHRHRIQGGLGIAYRYRRSALLLLFLACATCAIAQERSRQINEIEERIASLQRDVSALDKEHFQQTQAIETNRKNLADEEDLATVGSNWQATADHYLKQIREREQAYEDVRARSYQIPPEDQSCLDRIYLGFIKAPQRRIPRAVSGLYDRINARFDWMTYRRSLESEMRAGIKLANEPYPRRFEGYDDLVRQAQAEVLKSETARSNCVAYRENIARAEQRQSEIDQEQRQLRTQIRQLQHQLATLHDQPVEPSPPTPPRLPVVQVKVDPAFVEAAEPQGPAGMRTRTYRFFLLAEETAEAPAKLRLNWLRTDPLLPHRTAPSAYTRHRQGERELLLQAYLPVPLGKFNLTIRCPQLPGMPPSTLAVQRFLPPDYVENQKKYLQENFYHASLSQAELENERRNPRSTPERIAYRQANLADNLGAAARTLCNLGEYRQALDLIHKAYALLPERGGSSMQLAATGRVVEIETVAAFESADVPGFLAATRRLTHAREELVAEAIRLDRSPRLTLSSLYDAHALQADGMLVLTGDLRVVQAVVPKLRELHAGAQRGGTFEETVTRVGGTFSCLRAGILASEHR